MDFAFAEGYDDVTLVIPVENKKNTFLVGLGPSIGVVEWDGIANKTGKPQYVKLIDETPGNRLNDGKADATGRLWVGKYSHISVVFLCYGLLDQISKYNCLRQSRFCVSTCQFASRQKSVTYLDRVLPMQSRSTF